MNDTPVTEIYDRIYNTFARLQRPVQYVCRDLARQAQLQKQASSIASSMSIGTGKQFGDQASSPFGESATPFKRGIMYFIAHRRPGTPYHA